MLVAYFDESGTRHDSPITCVAGYLFRHQEDELFSRSWGRVLRSANIPYLRMSECAQGTDQFKNKSMRDRIETEKSLIELVKRRAMCGIAVTVCESEFQQVAHPAGSSYAYCLSWCLIGIAKWSEQDELIDGGPYPHWASGQDKLLRTALLA